MTERLLTKTAVFVVLERDGQIFLLRRANTGWADGQLTLPAGHVESGDGIRTTACKEVKEETGVDVREADLEFLHVDYSIDRYVNFYFRAGVWFGEPTNTEPEKASEGVWCDYKNLPEDTIDKVKNLFAQLQDNVLFSEYIET